MRIPMQLLAGFVGVAVLAGCGATAGRTGTTTSKSPRATVLFAQTGSSGTLTAAPGGRGDRMRLLTLRGVGRQTAWFQDRPGRRAGQLATADFVADWRRWGFDRDAPNAALTLQDGAPEADTLVVELADRPRYDARRRTLRSTVRLLGSAPDRIGALHGDRAVPARFGSASLFIDSSPAQVPTAVATGVVAVGTPITLADGASRPVDDLRAGNRVRSTGGASASVTGVQLSTAGTATAVILETTAGQRLVAARSTLVATPSGWRRAEGLQPGDELLVADGQVRVASLSQGKVTGGTVSVTTDSVRGGFYAAGILIGGAPPGS